MVARDFGPGVVAAGHDAESGGVAAMGGGGGLLFSTCTGTTDSGAQGADPESFYGGELAGGPDAEHDGTVRLRYFGAV